MAAALEGFGILYILEGLVAAPIADGRLTRLLEPCASRSPAITSISPIGRGRRPSNPLRGFSDQAEPCEEWAKRTGRSSGLIRGGRADAGLCDDVVTNCPIVCRSQCAPAAIRVVSVNVVEIGCN